METENRVYREGLPEVPKRMLSLPVERGYPVPWFVSKVQRPGPCPDNMPGCEVLHGMEEHYDFRVADGRKLVLAVRDRRCWICGERVGRWLAFVLGPMCTVTRTTSEPPNHKECAEFSMIACPFLTQQTSDYREGNLPAGVSDPAGMAIKRQPGCAALWVAESFKPFGDGNGGTLFTVGDPVSVDWYSHGRKATREEVQRSIATGFPTLFDLAKEEGLPSILELNRQLEAASRLIP